TVPDAYDVVANGRLVSVARADRVAGLPSTKTFTWENDEPTASYLVPFHAADLDIAHQDGSDHIPIIEALPPDLSPQQARYFDRVPARLAVFTWLFGPYPFDSLGNTVFADTAFDAALETQGMLSYDRSAVSERTIAHEIAHQWFGDSVSL